MTARTQISIRLAEWPGGAGVEDVKEFIVDALQAWGGQLHPQDPLFESLRLERVTIGNIRFEIPLKG